MQIPLKSPQKDYFPAITDYLPIKKFDELKHRFLNT